MTNNSHTYYTHTKAGGEGGGRSRFTEAEREQYARAQTPPLGEGWMVASADGRFDERIRRYFERRAKPPEPVADDCPQCRGSGWVYRDASKPDLGGVRCAHAAQRMPAQS